MLTVITHTAHKRPELLERCKRSVAAALPEGGQHLIIERGTKAEWTQHRAVDTIGLDLVAFVDDDDYISPDSLKTCLAALEQTGLGAACTNEVEVDESGKFISRAFGEKDYFAATLHPRVVHHVTVMRAGLIDVPRATELGLTYHVGIDWFIRQSVIQRYGCVSVPIDGYFWTQHPGQHTLHTRQLYASNMAAMGQEIRRAWPAKFTGKMPVFKV
jgi:hypothetical protein